MSTSPPPRIFTTHFVLGSKLLATCKWPHQYSHEQEHQPYSVAYFCPQCGEIWARIICSSQWSLLSRPCRKHTTSLSILAGGVFTVTYRQPELELPIPVLIEDFLFLMTLFDKLGELPSVT